MTQHFYRLYFITGYYKRMALIPCAVLSILVAYTTWYNILSSDVNLSQVLAISGPQFLSPVEWDDSVSSTEGCFEDDMRSEESTHMRLAPRNLH